MGHYKPPPMPLLASSSQGQKCTALPVRFPTWWVPVWARRTMCPVPLGSGFSIINIIGMDMFTQCFQMVGITAYLHSLSKRGMGG